MSNYIKCKEVFDDTCKASIQKLSVVRSPSGCDLMKCKYYVDGKCTDPNDWVNENGDAVCGLREDAILVE